MSDLVLVHRTFSRASSGFFEETQNTSLAWKTCLRQILFVDPSDPPDFSFHSEDQVFTGLEAECFLAEVLCGLKSPLLGETEVFGQFKLWWKSIPDSEIWKKRNQARIEGLFSLVKSIREKVLCGQGSQSYGSLLRRHLSARSPASTLDIIGNGHLAREILPWIRNKSAYRIWCRSPQKVSASALGQEAKEVLQLDKVTELSDFVIVAAPLNHEELQRWLLMRGFSEAHSLIDFRADSHSFRSLTVPKLHLRLGDFSSQHEEHRSEIEKKALMAINLILQWKEKQESKIQVRPYGWDDL